MARTASRFGGLLATAAVAAGSLLAAATVGPANLRAQEIRSPFGDGGDMGFSTRAPKRPPAGPLLPPMTGRAADPRLDETLPSSPARFDSTPASAGTIESTDLAPLDAASAPAPTDAGAGPGDPSGADASRIERLLTGLDLPPRSPALAELLRRQIAKPSATAGRGAAHAVRIEALYRAGALEEAARQLDAPGDDPILQALAARVHIARGRTDDGCGAARQASANLAGLPPRLAAEVIASQGYCAAVAGNASGAGLFAALARENEGASPVTIAILDAVGAGHPPAISDARRLTALDYRLLRLTNGVDLAALLARAEPALLAALAADQQIEPALRVRAAEAAASAGIIPPATLAAAWRLTSADAAEPLEQNTRTDQPLRRAGLFRAAEAERTPARKARLLRALLDDARRNGPYHAAMPLMAPATESLAPVAEIGWFAETAVEILTGAGRYDRARAWIRFAATLDPRNDLSHWLALIDISETAASVRRGENLGSVEDLALRGRFAAEALHRLAAVLDALDYNVPMRLWEAASRTQQPTQGHLPETGVLAELQAASRSRDGLATTALAIRSIGPGTADQANILALGDVIRALRRAGFETEARRFAYEALVVLWPRAASGG